MSNELSLWCINHTPHIESGCVGVRTEANGLITAILMNRWEWQKILKIVSLDQLSFENNGWRTALRFIMAHPHCDLELRDEYGKRISRWPSVVPNPDGPFLPAEEAAETGDEDNDDGPVFGGIRRSAVEHVVIGAGFGERERIYNLDRVWMVLKPEKDPKRYVKSPRIQA